MTASEHLKEIKEIDLLIRYKQARIKELWDSAVYTGVSYEPRVQSSRNFDKRSDTICKIIELEEDIKELQEEMQQMKAEAIEAAKGLNDENQEQVIVQRYVEFKSWNEIATNLGCSRRWILELNRRALKKLSNSFVVHS